MSGLRVKLAIGVAVLGVVVTGAAAVAGSHNRAGDDADRLRGGAGDLDRRLRHVPRCDHPTAATRSSTSCATTGIATPVLQAHIHFGQEAVNGGISAFLCSNLGNGPAGTQPCPPPPARVTGTISAADVVGPDGQGSPPASSSELVRALRAGVAYANVHSDQYKGGEIRGQIEDDRGHR